MWGVFVRETAGSLVFRSVLTARRYGLDLLLCVQPVLSFAACRIVGSEGRNICEQSRHEGAQDLTSATDVRPTFYCKALSKAVGSLFGDSRTCQQCCSGLLQCGARVRRAVPYVLRECKCYVFSSLIKGIVHSKFSFTLFNTQPNVDGVSFDFFLIYIIMFQRR